MAEQPAAVTLAELVGRPVAEVKEALGGRGIEVRTEVEAIGGPLALLVPATSAPAVPAHGRVIAYTAAERVTRFVVDEAGSFRGALERQAARLEEMEKRVASLETAIGRLERARGGSTAAERSTGGEPAEEPKPGGGRRAPRRAPPKR